MRRDRRAAGKQITSRFGDVEKVSSLTDRARWRREREGSGSNCFVIRGHNRNRIEPGVAWREIARIAGITWFIPRQDFGFLPLSPGTVPGIGNFNSGTFFPAPAPPRPLLISLEQFPARPSSPARAPSSEGTRGPIDFRGLH